ncbi:DUF2478 domain-containing protein [Arenibacterium sp. CAU 1754]
MQLAYVMTEKRGETDRLLSAFAEGVLQGGAQLAGVVQTNTECSDTRLCDMDVRVLPDGPVIRISQSLGPGARGCRLDPAALEQAVALVQTGLSENPELLIVNKFGKHEADGGGFRPLIGQALIEGIPVLTGVNRMNEKAFLDFADGLAIQVDPTEKALGAWFDQLRQSTSEPA